MSDSITKIYQQNQSQNSFIVPFFFILAVLSVFGYLYANARRKLLQLSWDDNKCNPRYLFFSGFMNPLQKDPWGETETNFKRCVASNIYKDPVLDKEIKKNRLKIQERDKEMKENLGTGKGIVQGIKQQWEAIMEGGLLDLQVTNADNTRIFEKQGMLHEKVAKKTTQVFQVMKSVLFYIQGILVLRMGEEKTKLNIDARHDAYMTRYMKIHEDYNAAYDKLKKGEYNVAIFHARKAIEAYKELNDDLDKFMNSNYKSIKDITQGCYQLRYNMENESCGIIFPNINRGMVDYYATIADN